MPRKAGTKKPTVKKISTQGGKKTGGNTAPILESAQPAGPSNEEKFFSQYNNYYRVTASARRWMWISIAIFTVTIIALWGYAMEYRITNTDWQKATQKGLVGQTQQNWNQIFAETKKKENLKKEIIEILNQYAATSTISAGEISTSTASTTEFVSPTTTLSATSTAITTSTKKQ